MLKELEDQKGKLRKESLALTGETRQLNEQASKWAARRNELNRATEELINKAKEFKKLRDESNKSVAHSKRKRDESNEMIGQLYANIDDIRKKQNLTQERSIGNLHGEIEQLEFRQQTEILSPEREKQLVNKITVLRAEFKRRREQLEKNEELRKLLDEAQSLRDLACSYHDQVKKFANMAQEYHDQMIAAFKEADQTRAEADSAQKEYLKSLNKSL